MNATRDRHTRFTGYTEQDLCNYAHHLWIQSGMRFNGDPWAEARACLDANLPRARIDGSLRSSRPQRLAVRAAD